MKFLKMFKREKPRRAAITDFYQASIEKVGRDQIKKLADKGLSIPVFVL